MNAAEVLTKARALIADENRWTQGKYARDALGEEAEPFEAGAVCFCALGAIAHVADLEPEHDLPGEQILKEEAYFADGSLCVPMFNDKHTHAEVLDLFDRAIARAESEEA